MLQKNKFITAKEIARVCGFPTNNTQVLVRKAITELIEIDDTPIISTARGFSYNDSPPVLRGYAQSLMQRELGIKRRINKVMKIADKLDDNRPQRILTNY